MLLGARGEEIEELVNRGCHGAHHLRLGGAAGFGPGWSSKERAKCKERLFPKVRARELPTCRIVVVARTSRSARVSGALGRTSQRPALPRISGSRSLRCHSLAKNHSLRLLRCVSSGCSQGERLRTAMTSRLKSETVLLKIQHRVPALRKFRIRSASRPRAAQSAASSFRVPLRVPSWPARPRHQGPTCPECRGQKSSWGRIGRVSACRS